MQHSFSDLEYAANKKQTRLLAEIGAVTPWRALVAELETFYPKSGRRGRPPLWLERMLRMYVARLCFGLSDEGIEYAVYDSQSIRRFVGIDLSRKSITLLKFRQKHGLLHKSFKVINGLLAQSGLLLREGTIRSATLIPALISTKSPNKARGPSMQQARKGNQRYCGTKTRIDVDAVSDLAHAAVGSCGAGNMRGVYSASWVNEQQDCEMQSWPSLTVGR